MVIVFECDRQGNLRPGMHRSEIMTRIWWLWFAITWLHVSLPEFTMTAYGWTTR